MNKEYHIQEMEHVLHDVLNPLNDRDTEIEAWNLVENEGWRKIQMGKWIPVQKSLHGVVYKCNICGYIDFHVLGMKHCPECISLMEIEKDTKNNFSF